jgi:hypothetical protein
MTAVKLKEHRHNVAVTSPYRYISLITAFILGLAVCSSFFLWHTNKNDPTWATIHHHPSALLSPLLLAGQLGSLPEDRNVSTRSLPSSSILDGLRVLVTIASFDFMQLSHLEEVLDGFHDLCYSGSKVDIVIYTTVLVSSILRAESEGLSNLVKFNLIGLYFVMRRDVRCLNEVSSGPN